jgi:hypothetical protein
MSMFVRQRMPKEIVDKARVFSKRVYALRKGNKDKWVDDSEKEADFLGFLFEFAAARYFDTPEPKLYERKASDDYDVVLKGMKVDLKHSPKCLINKEQFERKKGKADAFLFGEMELLDYSLGEIYVKFYGWIPYEEVEANSEIVPLHAGSEAYKVFRHALSSVEELKEAGK